MVGHSGNLAATIKAVECLDQCLEKITAALKQVGGECLITSDHGNAEKMQDQTTGQAHTAHTNAPVPLIYLGRKASVDLAPASLSDIAPTLLALLGLEQPPEMTGKNIFKIL